MVAPSDELKRQYSYFHANSKILSEDSQYLSESKYKSSHISFINDILADTIPYCLTPTDADQFTIDRPNVLRKYNYVPLTQVGGSNGQSWYINDAGKWMKPFVTGSLVPHPDTNATSAFRFRLSRENGTPISPTEGRWWYDPYQGIVKFEQGYTPADMGWGTPKLYCYVYVGRTLDSILKELETSVPKTFKYLSNQPTVQHLIPHNLQTMDLSVHVQVQDPITLSWSRDIVGVDYPDKNNIYINLTESSNIRVNVKEII